MVLLPFPNPTPTKGQCKEQVTSSIYQHIESRWKEDTESNKSSLKYLNPSSVKVGKVHQIYAYVNNSNVDVWRAEIKASLLTLQSNRASSTPDNLIRDSLWLCTLNLYAIFRQ